MQHLLLTPRGWISEGRGGRAGKRWALLGKYKEDSPVASRSTDIYHMFKPSLYCNQIKRKLCLHYEINFVSEDGTTLGAEIYEECMELYTFSMNK